MTSDHVGCTSANQIQSWRSTDERSDIQEHPDAPYSFGLLRARHQRPHCRRAADQPDELAPFHPITSSAVASSDGGTVRPGILAVLRLITVSY
jgi:hypothetical protein